MEVHPSEQAALPNRHAARTKLGSVYPNSSPDRKKVGFAEVPESLRRTSADAVLQKTPSTDETTQRTLKSCMSAPNLSGMATMKRNVSFHKIEIREYHRTLGDNPCVSAGPPLSLDWNYNPAHRVFDVEAYEEAKTPRSKSEMLMPRQVREVILKEHWDVSRSEINAMARNVNITKRNRRATARTSRVTEKRMEQVENASRTVKRILSLGKKRDEKKLLKDVKTMCGKRVYSMNDLAAYTVINAKCAETATPAETSTSSAAVNVATAQPQYLSQDSLSSSGNESATSLPATLEDDDDWGFYEEE